jgi:hypothetical protein
VRGPCTWSAGRGEGAAHARRAAQGELAAQQRGQLAADGEAEAVPPYLRLVEASACWKASNTIFCFSTGMPTPVSVTSKATTELAWLSACCRRASRLRRQHAQPHAALGGELQRVATAGSSGSAAGAWSR